MRLSLTALLVSVAFATLSGCGQTGPLYMPGEPPPETQPEAQQEVQPAAPADITVQPTPGP
jgi:predicted small lipoprotein YifL